MAFKQNKFGVFGKIYYFCTHIIPVNISFFMKKVLYILQLFIILTIVACHNTGNSTNSALNADTTTLFLYVDSADALFGKADYKQSLIVAKQALNMGEELRDTESISNALSTLLSDYQQLGMTDSALTAARQLLEMDKKVGNSEYLSADYNNLAFIYTARKQYSTAREFIEKAIEMEKKVDGSPHLATRYGLAAEIHLGLSNDKKQADSLKLREQSLDFANKAYDLEAAKNDTLRMGRRLSQRGDVLLAMNRTADAERDYIKAINFLEPIGERHSLAITYRQLGSMLLAQHKNAQAIPHLEKAAKMTREDHELESLMKAYDKLQEAYKSIDEKKSNEYLVLYTQTKDSVYTLESARSLSEFHALYDTDKEKERAAQKQRQLIMTWVICSLAFLAFIALVIWLNMLLRRRKRHNAELRNEILQLKQQMEEQQQQFLQQMKQEQEESVPASQTNEADKKFIESVNEALFRIMGNKEVSAENIASELCITSQQLRRRIKAIKDITPLAYLTSLRMGYARQLLTERQDLSIEQVGLLCGYNEATHFTRAFKKETEMTPSQFRSR